jgi:hypothetical protein
MLRQIEAGGLFLLCDAQADRSIDEFQDGEAPNK